MPANAINDELLEEARKLGKHRTKKQALEAALQAYVTQRKQLAILDLAGEIEYWPESDRQPLRGKKQK